MNGLGLKVKSRESNLCFFYLPLLQTAVRLAILSYYLSKGLTKWLASEDGKAEKLVVVIFGQLSLSSFFCCGLFQPRVAQILADTKQSNVLDVMNQLRKTKLIRLNQLPKYMVGYHRKITLN